MESKTFPNDPLESIAINRPRTVPFRDCEAQSSVAAVLVYPRANHETRALETAVSGKYPFEFVGLAEPACSRKVFRSGNCAAFIYQEVKRNPPIGFESGRETDATF